MYTISRTRTTENPTERVILHPVKERRKYDYCSSVETLYPIGNFTIDLNKYSKTIVDETLDLSNLSYEDRYQYLQSDAYNAYKLKFKQILNVEKAYSLDFNGGQLNYTDRSGPGLTPYWDFCRKYWFEGDAFIDYLTYYYTGLYPIDPVVQFKLKAEFIDATVMTDLDKSIMVKELSSDARLIGSEEFSVANFIYEIKEVLNLTSLFKLKADTFTKKGLADKHLGYNFGVTPLISDIKAIYDILANLNMRINNWNSFVGTQKTLNAHMTYRDIPGDLVDFIYIDPWERTENHVTGTFSAKVIGHTYFEPILISEIDKLKLHLSLTGLGNPLSIIWEAIPYSFLVDWVFNVGDMIEAFEASEPVIKTAGQTYGYSVKYELALTNNCKIRESFFPHVEVYTDGPSPYSDDLVQMCDITSYENYYFRNIIPIGNLPVITPFNIMEFTWEQSPEHVGLAAALYFQR